MLLKSFCLTLIFLQCHKCVPINIDLLGGCFWRLYLYGILKGLATAKFLWIPSPSKLCGKVLCIQFPEFYDVNSVVTAAGTSRVLSK